MTLQLAGHILQQDDLILPEGHTLYCHDDNDENWLSIQRQKNGEYIISSINPIQNILQLDQSIDFIHPI